MDLDEETHVSSSKDLIKQFRKKNESVFAVEIYATSEDVAMALGYKEAFFENYTAHDSTSDLIEISKRYKMPRSVDKVVKQE